MITFDNVERNYEIARKNLQYQHQPTLGLLYSLQHPYQM